jgi:hypothetical protein
MWTNAPVKAFVESIVTLPSQHRDRILAYLSRQQLNQLESSDLTREIFDTYGTVFEICKSKGANDLQAVTVALQVGEEGLEYAALRSGGSGSSTDGSTWFGV